MQRKIKRIFCVRTPFFRNSHDIIKSNIKLAPKLLGLNVDVKVDEVVVVQHTGERSEWRHSLVGKMWFDVAKNGYSICRICECGFDPLGSG